MVAWAGAWSRPTLTDVKAVTFAIEAALGVGAVERSAALGRIIRDGHHMDPEFQLDLAVTRHLKWKWDKGEEPNENRWRIKR